MYGDGANLNALLGIVRPGDLGFDVMHFNLHKTFATPHGGGGPGSGPVGVSAALAAFLPGPSVIRDGDTYRFAGTAESVGRMLAFHGNFGIMLRAFAYIRSMGAQGLKTATEMAVLNANYVRAGLAGHFNLPYDTATATEIAMQRSPAEP